MRGFGLRHVAAAGQNPAQKLPGFGRRQAEGAVPLFLQRQQAAIKLRGLAKISQLAVQLGQALQARQGSRGSACCSRS